VWEGSTELKMCLSGWRPPANNSHLITATAFQPSQQPPLRGCDPGSCSDGDSTRLCETLTARGIPFVIYSGFNKVEGACKAGPLVTKPATGEAVVATAEGLLP
jgi:hypothetical protein